MLRLRPEVEKQVGGGSARPLVPPRALGAGQAAQQRGPQQMSAGGALSMARHHADPNR
jgi:hypothetical protein